MKNNVSPRLGEGETVSHPRDKARGTQQAPGTGELHPYGLGGPEGAGGTRSLLGVSLGAPRSSPALGEGWEQAELRAAGFGGVGCAKDELEWDCAAQWGRRGSQRDGTGGCCGSIPNRPTGVGFHGSALQPGNLGSCCGSQLPSHFAWSPLFPGTPMCLRGETGNELRDSFRWRAQPLLSLLNSSQPSSFLLFVLQILPSTHRGGSSGRRKPHQAPAVPVTRLERLERLAGQRSSHLWAATRAIPAPPAESGVTPAGTREILAPAHLAEAQQCSWAASPLPLRTPRPRQGPLFGAGAPQGWEQNHGFASPHEHRAPAKTPHS